MIGARENGVMLLVIGVLMLAWGMLQAIRYGGADLFLFNMPLKRLFFVRATVFSALWFLVAGAIMFGLR